MKDNVTFTARKLAADAIHLKIVFNAKSQDGVLMRYESGKTILVGNNGATKALCRDIEDVLTPALKEVTNVVEYVSSRRTADRLLQAQVDPELYQPTDEELAEITKLSEIGQEAMEEALAAIIARMGDDFVKGTSVQFDMTCKRAPQP